MPSNKTRSFLLDLLGALLIGVIVLEAAFLLTVMSPAPDRSYHTKSDRLR
jgi:hypothetical protein